ncbi:ABC transporter ATP-binding protein [Actibacterium sp.]|uniref:ABC transporter ATP-binding protein n=1 Tax=Actibacterium sp. TaxID=1872125 RepID=UPI0035666793
MEQQADTLKVDDLAKSFGRGSGRVTLFQGLSFSVAAGQAVALTGESGSGKSTLLHLCAGLDVPDAGRVCVAGQDLSRLREPARAAVRRDRIGLVFQHFNLVPSLNVAANLSFQARLAGRPDAGWCDELTTRLGLAGLEHRYPEQLSGGQQQRVAIGRALASRPDLILADEPTGNLDQASGDAVMELLLSLVAQTGAALVMVTHSERLAGRLPHRLHLANGRLA